MPPMGGQGEPPDIGKMGAPGGQAGKFSLNSPAEEKSLPPAVPNQGQPTPGHHEGGGGPVMAPPGGQATAAEAKKFIEKSMMKITHSMLHQVQENFKQEQAQDWGSGASGGGCC